MAAPASDDGNVYETIIVWFLQILGAASAVIFGVYTALSWRNSNDAKYQADMANMVAVVALCAQLKESGSDSPAFLGFCNGVQRAAESSVSILASALLGTITPVTPVTSTPTSSPTTSRNSTTTTSHTGSNSTPTMSPDDSPGSSQGLSYEVKVAIGAAVGIGLPMILAISWLTIKGYRHRYRRRVSARYNIRN